MARKPSVILTPTEKKAAAADVKNLIKAAEANKKTAVASRKALEKNYAAETERLEKQYLDGIKASDKALAALEKEIGSLTAKHLHLIPLKAVPSPTN